MLRVKAATGRNGERRKREGRVRVEAARSRIMYAIMYVGILIRVAAEVQPVGNARAVASLARNLRTDRSALQSDFVYAPCAFSVPRPSSFVLRVPTCYHARDTSFLAPRNIDAG